MRAVLVGNDYLKDNNGNFRHLESNTSVLPSFARTEDYFNKPIFDQFLSDNNITDIVIIDAIGPNFVNDILDKQHDGNSSFQKISHMLANTYGDTHNVSFISQNQNGSLPFIEDSVNKLILRIAYDGNALVDDTYCRDNFSFLKLISDNNPNSLPNTFFNDGGSNNMDTIGTTITDNGNHPNFIIKERYPTVNYANYPKVYRINTEGELNTLKNGLGGNELLQEYICNTNDLSDGKLKTYRHLTILYGGDLSVLNVFDIFSHSNRIPITNDVDYDDTTNELSIWERPKYLQKTGQFGVGDIYTGSENDSVQKGDGALVKLKDLRLDDTLSTVEIPFLDTEENSYVKWKSNLNDINSSHITYTPKFEGPFGGFEHSDGVYTNPSTSESWGGFANTNENLVDITFTEGGRITFNASCDGSAQVMFLLEKDPYDTNGNGDEDTEPNYTTDLITISGTVTTEYSLEIPSQGLNGYSSFVMKVVTQDVAVDIDNTKIISYKSGISESISNVESIKSDSIGFFEHTINLSGGKSYTFLNKSFIISAGPNSDEYGFNPADSLIIGCKVLTRSLSGGEFTPETIISISYKYVHEVAYSVDVEDIDYYFRTDNSATPSQGVVHHNKEQLGCQCYFKNFEWTSCNCNSPCIYAPGECPDFEPGFIDCCASAPFCDGGTYSQGPCGEGGKQ